MAGRPKKKPEYNPELQFNHFLHELRAAYEEADSLRLLADELNISLLKLRKLLITADVFTSDTCTEINALYQSGKKVTTLGSDSASSKGCAIRQVEILPNKLLTTAFEASLGCVAVM